MRVSVSENFRNERWIGFCFLESKKSDGVDARLRSPRYQMGWPTVAASHRRSTPRQTTLEANANPGTSCESNSVVCVFRDSKAASGTQPTALPCPPYVPFSWTAVVGCRTESEALKFFTSSPSVRRGTPSPTMGSLASSLPLV